MQLSLSELNFRGKVLMIIALCALKKKMAPENVKKKDINDRYLEIIRQVPFYF